MNHIVPDFKADEDYLISELHKKSSMGGNEDIMELLWHNGQVVMQNRNQISGGNKRPPSQVQLAATTTSREVTSGNERLLSQTQLSAMTVNRDVRSSVVVDREAGLFSDLFMREDEMTSWLHYPGDENSLEEYLYNNDLIYPTPSPTTASTSLPPPLPSVMITSSRPPVPPFRLLEMESRAPKYTNFMHFSRPVKRFSPELGQGQSSSSKTVPTKKLPTQVVASKAMPSIESQESKASSVSDNPTPMNKRHGGSMCGVGVAGTSSAWREMETCELSVTSSPGSGGGSRGSPLPPPSDDRKRKGIDTHDNECHSEDVEFEYHDAKKQSHGGSTSTKRSRAAEVHNLSERKRRDRINEKMKALQELIPRGNKSDKASMLDEAIEYLKSLQMQVQMMSMGCSMVPMMFPGVQQYVPPMGMGMGIGMDMGMNRTMVPYPAIIPGPRNHPIASQAANMSSPMTSLFPQHNQNQPLAPNFVDPFQQYIGLHQTQLTLPQNQGGVPPIATKPSSSKEATNPDHHQTGQLP